MSFAELATVFDPRRRRNSQIKTPASTRAPPTPAPTPAPIAAELFDPLPLFCAAPVGIDAAEDAFDVFEEVTVAADEEDEVVLLTRGLAVSVLKSDLLRLLD